jgi:hypothetical protein
METFIKELDEVYREVIGNYDVSSFEGKNIYWHGCQVLEEFAYTWYDIIMEMDKIKEKEITFLELGAFKGLWSLAFHLACKRLNKIPKYTTVTLMQGNFLDGQDFDNQDLLKCQQFYQKNNLEFNLINNDTTSIKTIEEVSKISKNYNFVFIDADHRYDFVKSDIKNYHPLSKNITLFHDTKPRIKTHDFGIYEAIIDSNLQLTKEYSECNSHFGIGLIYKDNK